MSAIRKCFNPDCGWISDPHWPESRKFCPECRTVLYRTYWNNVLKHYVKGIVAAPVSEKSNAIRFAREEDIDDYPRKSNHYVYYRDKLIGRIFRHEYGRGHRRNYNIEFYEISNMFQGYIYSLAGAKAQIRQHKEEIIQKYIKAQEKKS